MVVTIPSGQQQAQTNGTGPVDKQMAEREQLVEQLKQNGVAAAVNGMATNGATANGTNGVASATNGVNGSAAANGKAANGAVADVKLANGVNGVDTVARVRSYVLEAVRDTNELKELAEYALDYAHSIGLVARPAESRHCSDIAQLPPLSLLPSPFPEELYHQALDVQQTLNELYFKIANDHDFLIGAYKDVVKGDPYIARNVQIAELIHAEGVHQPIGVCVQRADYMSHWNAEQNKLELKQVEVNIGQIGGPGCATAVTKQHKKMLDRVDILHQGKLAPLNASHGAPDNRPRHKMAQTMYQAWKLFGDENAVLLFVNQPDLFPVCHFEQLQFCQFQVEKLAKREGKRVEVIRMNFKECAERIRLDETDFSLYADGNKKIGLIHMAYGYLAEHYPTEAEWNVRIAMERSTAILSPNIRLQLSGTKKIQQVLAKPGVLERYFPDEPAKVAHLRSTFTGIWGLENDDEVTRAVIQEAIRTPKNFVLKAQMGAGKGNYFDDEMAQKLQTMDLEERGAYILQKKIWPISVKNYMLRPFKEPQFAEVVSEVGIYGSIIADSASGQVHWNSADGYLCRSKAANVNQGGVSEGAGCVDSLLLYPANEFC